MAYTVSDLVSRALREIGELPAGETVDGDYADDCLETLNALIEQLTLEDLLLNYEKTEEFDLVNGQEAYTIGDSGDFNTVRPTEILSAQLRDANSLDTSLDLISNDTYQRLTQKETSPTLPTKVCYNPDYPLGKLTFWPTPAAGLKVRLSSRQLLTSFADLSDVVTLPNGMKEVLVYGLADRLCLPAGRLDLVPYVSGKFEDAKANVKRKNVNQDLMDFDGLLPGGARGSYNPYNDQ